jgi:6-phosphofructokinase 2
MDMTAVITITINPAIDVLMSVERIVPTHKMRCTLARRDPGGGGINVARVLRRLGNEVIAVYPTGGLLGTLLRRLVDEEGVPCLTIGIAQETREDITILERTTALQYRFIQPGPELTKQEWQACLNAIGSLYRRDVATHLEHRGHFLVASGSIPPGVPEEFYSQVASIAHEVGARMVVDASGVPLKRALEAGVYLVKPSLSELSELLGRSLDREAEFVSACRGLIDDKRAEVVALTLGEQGALVVTRDQALIARALAIRPVSVVGAGDSFLAAMIWSLSSGRPIEIAFRYAVAAASATLLMPGTELCRRDDVERLVNDVKVRAI